MKSYSEERLIETVWNNLNCLMKIIKFNIDHDILFIRITSDLVPFASHPICRFNWQQHFKEQFKEIGRVIKSSGVRISMHPDQFTIINSLDERIFENSYRELLYHAQVLDLLELDNSAKIQVHVGGTYGDKAKSVKRFAEKYGRIQSSIRRRLVIENDDRYYSLRDCVEVSWETGIPVLFDVYHHEMNKSGETLNAAFKLFAETWSEGDGLPMVDYSSQKLGGRRGRHTESIDLDHFKRFLLETKPYDFDVMLEVKDKEKSAIKAVKIAAHDERFSPSLP